MELESRLRCTSKRFGPRMFCFCYGPTDRCAYCGLPMAPLTQEQIALIEAGRNETWWRPDA